MIVYFSNVTGNTHRFVSNLRHTTRRIPVQGDSAFPDLEPYVLITPTYGEGRGTRVVPRQVERFLEHHSSELVAVISSGNLAFGEDFARAGDVVSQRYSIPLLHIFEMSGTDRDVLTVSARLDELWPPTSVPTTLL